MSCAFVTSRIRELPLVLASASPRRSRILEGLDVDFVHEPHSIDERELPGETPEAHVVRLAREKALDTARRRDRGTVLGADTIVLFEGRVIGKPAGEEDARTMLSMLQGRTHDVLTGLALVRASDGAVVSDVERTRVTFRELDEREIAQYVAHGEPMDKAGSYAIQDCGAGLVRRVEGCFYNVVGLPVVLLLTLLDDLGALEKYERMEA
ncbi:MAG: septum formation protein Maf [Candidatus Eisenbacteria bacterium]|nr:septum formation protein Maf [Candidatus Eisenbacteria bacterium]